MSTPAHLRLSTARTAQAAWRARSVQERLRVIAALRGLIARDGRALAQAAGAARQRALAESLTAEVIPLAEGCAFLQRSAAQALKPRKVGRAGRPIWLAGVTSLVLREPHGVVLVVGPANYPLLLPGSQALQALVAGNAVLLKPGRESTAAANLFAQLCAEAGLPSGLLQILPEDVEQVHQSLQAGVNLVVFTGSTEAGRAVLKAAAEHVVPVIAELSGDDAYIVRADAEPQLAARALAFGQALNAGNSCIAPRRVVVVGPPLAATAQQCGDSGAATVPTDAAALECARNSPYGLGACIISSDEAAARRLAEELPVGVVVINDCIMPTADARLPFGGRGRSGYGVTRGLEGLQAMTRPKVIITQRGARRHLDPTLGKDDHFFTAYLQAAHGAGWRYRFQALRRLCQRAAAQMKSLS